MSMLKTTKAAGQLVLALQERLLAGLRAADSKDLKGTLRALVQQSPSAPPGSQSGRPRRYSASKSSAAADFSGGAAAESNGMNM